MPNYLRQIALLALAASIPAGGVAAQALPPSGAPADADQAALAELQQVQQQLGQLQIQAITDNAALEAQRSTIDDMLLSAMSDIDPETQQNIDRLDVLSQEAISAQQAQDAEAINALMTEAMQLRSALEAAQAQALQRDDIQTEIQRFEDDLMAAVVEIDPEADGLYTRIDELSEQLGVAGPGGG